MTLKGDIIMSRKKIPESDYEKIVDMYLRGYSSVKIGQLYNTSHKPVLSVLDKMGIPRNWNSLRKYNINEHYFDNIDTPNKAYILGLLYADGYNNTSTNVIRLGLQEQDKKILEDIAKEVGYDAPLIFYEHSKEHEGWKDVYTLAIRSAHMSNVLNNLGMHKAKSLILEFPKWLDKNLYSHFIRGYFDGDGSVYCYEKKMNWNISIVSTKNFCEFVKNIVENELGIHVHVKLNGRRNDITSDIRIGGNRQVLRFLDWIYKDSDLRMERKYIKYQQLLDYENINNSLVS